MDSKQFKSEPIFSIRGAYAALAKEMVAGVEVSLLLYS